MIPGRLAPQPGLPSGRLSPAALDSTYGLTPPHTPGTAVSTASTAYSVGSRTKRLGRKLSFWKKGEASAADVRSSLRALQKSHQKSTAATQHAVSTLHSWSAQLDAPPKFPRGWPMRHASPELQELLVCLCQALYPVLASDAAFAQLFADFASGLRSLSYYEENCKRVAADVVAADRRYYKERRRCTRLIEVGSECGDAGEAETVAAGELAVYENACLGMRSQMAEAGVQYRRQCAAELPRQLAPLLAYTQKMEDVLRQAITMAQSARLDYPQAEFDVRSAPPLSGLYSPPPSAPLRCSPLRTAAGDDARRDQLDIYMPAAINGPSIDGLWVSRPLDEDQA